MFVFKLPTLFDVNKMLGNIFKLNCPDTRKVSLISSEWRQRLNCSIEIMTSKGRNICIFDPQNHPKNFTVNHFVMIELNLWFYLSFLFFYVSILDIFTLNLLVIPLSIGVSSYHFTCITVIDNLYISGTIWNTL